MENQAAFGRVRFVRLVLMDGTASTASSPNLEILKRTNQCRLNILKLEADMRQKAHWTHGLEPSIYQSAGLYDFTVQSSSSRQGKGR